MPNIASVFKSEIIRVTRKEVRSETDVLRKSILAQRSSIVSLKRELAELRKELRSGGKTKKPAVMDFDNSQENEVKRRFSPARLATHRAKLGFSAADYGVLVGVSAQSIYLYEQGKSRPHADVVRKLAMIKELSKQNLVDRLNEAKASA